MQPLYRRTRPAAVPVEPEQVPATASVRSNGHYHKAAWDALKARTTSEQLAAAKKAIERAIQKQRFKHDLDGEDQCD
jgi:hypothetical protein